MQTLRSLLRPLQSCRVNAVLRTALVVVVAFGVTACKTTRPDDVTGSIGPAAARGSDPNRGELDRLGALYRANPKDVQTAIAYARILRVNGQRAQAVAVLEQSVIQHPKNQLVLGEYGRALADVGNFQQALNALGQAHSPDRPDWRIMSAQGAVLDQMGRHAEAQRYYKTALKIAPDEPSILSNLGLSYALSKKLPQAEATLRRAAARPGADPRVRQNLALVVGLEGRFAEAENIAKADLPPAEAAANVAYLRQMLSRSNAHGPAGVSAGAGRGRPAT